MTSNNWRPIETAPRDGTWILCGWKNSAGRRGIPCSLCWHRAGGWTHIDPSLEPSISGTLQPILWQPLPELPGIGPVSSLVTTKHGSMQLKTPAALTDAQRRPTVLQNEVLEEMRRNGSVDLDPITNRPQRFVNDHYALIFYRRRVTAVAFYALERKGWIKWHPFDRNGLLGRRYYLPEKLALP